MHSRGSIIVKARRVPGIFAEPVIVCTRFNTKPGAVQYEDIMMTGVAPEATMVSRPHNARCKETLLEAARPALFAIVRF